MNSNTSIVTSLSRGEKVHSQTFLHRGHRGPLKDSNLGSSPYIYIYNEDQFTLANSDHHKHFLKPHSDGKMSGCPATFNILSPKIEVAVGEHIWIL